ncbi:hypothetical protein BJ684DRAFT_21249 [Piptocephalis cylindrospora]|uniref:Small integral membrane protein 8 n=1 Tax=Piptocephalis cylindrospora TaxID=1907219 RepID=A0A4P9Y0C3_9FUNG|nr:hypothetical protein BJ684DRAFT_21249 [Piptocephalis cylindrospora]|eukprot:RKP12195.1 hypothetical protein BJ684DRAFT_21249 [Piptocephalis cylindrospora]
MSQNTSGGGEKGGKVPSPPAPSTGNYGFFEGQRAATRIFKLTNPELFMKNNKYVMAFGVVTFTSLVAYFALDNAKYAREQEEKRRRYEERRRIREQGIPVNYGVDE